MDWLFLKKDIQYIILNHFVCRIPSWHLRRLVYTGFGMTIKKDARIGINTIIISPENISIGRRSVVNNNCVIDGSGGVIIEDDVSISAFSKIYSCTHKVDSVFFEYTTNPVMIKNNVWIGANAMILDGSILNEFTVLGANCTFKGVSEKSYIYYGNPARKLKKRNLNKKYRIDFHPHFR